MKYLFTSWVWRMAWRDARRNLAKLSLAMACVIIGVAAVAAAMSFRDNLTSSVREQSKSLLGADLAIAGRVPFSQESEGLIASLGGEQSRQIGFSSMAYFPQSGSLRLVQVRAVSGGFPYYGKLETEPASAAAEFQGGANALVDENLMLQFNARIGDRLRIGDQEFRIAGKLRKIPGESLTFSLVSPRIYLPLAHFNQPQLLQKGSLVRYRVFFKLAAGVDVNQLVQKISPQLQQLRLEADTVRMRAAAIARAMDNLSRFLGLAVFIAVLLAGVGVGSGMHVYAKEKSPSVAVLRCIGANPGQTIAVYVIQASMIALAGASIGAALGVGLQALLPIALKDFLPVDAIFSLAPQGILTGMAIGLVTSLLFALLPLLSLRKVSPLFALRSSYEERRQARDPLIGFIFFLILSLILGFALATAQRWFHALWFAGGVLAAFGFIAFVARGTSALMRKLAPDILPFPWRQGLANLHRPNNQTTAVMLSIGLGTFLLVTLYNVQSMLLKQIDEKSGRGEPNLVLFDVQSDQRAGIAALFTSFNNRLYEEVPIVTTRLAAIRGKRVEEIRNDPKTSIPPWALRREYRSTYRSRLTSAEQIIKGTWTGSVKADAQPIPISLEKGIAETLRVGLGDRLDFELSGALLVTQVASIREVDWQRVQPNFFVLFPEGVLEQAPKFYAIVTRAESSQLSATLQRAVVERFPNVSMIDLTLILSTLNSILGKVTAAIRFVALFTILTGVTVLGSAILSRRSERVRESILLRTLGARRRQLVNIIIAEYLLLGAISSLTGALLASLASWGLSFYFLGTIAAFALSPIAVIVILATATTALLGVLGCWGIFRRPALEALRAEA
jgi:putative ABC transport system permease protein